MKVENTTKLVKLNQIDLGGVFKVDGETYIKTAIKSIDGETCLCINLQNGLFCYLKPIQTVESVKCKLVIE